MGRPKKALPSLAPVQAPPTSQTVKAPSSIPEAAPRTSVNKKLDKNDLFFCIDGLGSLVPEQDGDGHRYLCGVDAADVIRDIVRYLKRDDPVDRIFFRCLGEWKIAKNHLLPMLEQFSDTALHTEACQLLYLVSEWPTSDSAFQAEQMENLMALKEDVLNSRAMPTMLTLLVDPVTKIDAGEDLSEEDSGRLMLILTVFCNLLRVPDPPRARTSAGAHRDHLHDDFIRRLFEMGIIDLFISIGNFVVRDKNGRLAMVIAEMFSHLFRGQEAATLPDAATETGKEEFRSQDRFGQPLDRKRVAPPPLETSRHSRFGGVLKYKGEDGKMYTWNHGISELNRPSRLDAGKSRQRGKPKLASRTVAATSSVETKRLLDAIAAEFVEVAYDAVMKTATQWQAGERYERLDDEILDRHSLCYLSAFMTAYHCARTRFLQKKWRKENPAGADGKEPPLPPELAFTIAPIACTSDADAFQWLLGLLKANNAEKRWSENHIVVTCLREKLNAIAMMDASEDEDNQRMAHALLSRIFYESEVQNALLDLIKDWTPRKHTREFLSEIVSTIHVFTKQLQKSTKERKVFVRRKKHQRKPKALAEGEGAEEGAEGAQGDPAAGGEAALTGPVEGALPIDRSAPMQTEQAVGGDAPRPSGDADAAWALDQGTLPDSLPVDQSSLAQTDQAEMPDPAPMDAEEENAAVSNASGADAPALLELQPASETPSADAMTSVALPAPDSTAAAPNKNEVAATDSDVEERVVRKAPKRKGGRQRAASDDASSADGSAKGEAAEKGEEREERGADEDAAPREEDGKRVHAEGHSAVRADREEEEEDVPISALRDILASGQEASEEAAPADGIVPATASLQEASLAAEDVIGQAGAVGVGEVAGEEGAAPGAPVSASQGEKDSGGNSDSEEGFEEDAGERLVSDDDDDDKEEARKREREEAKARDPLDLFADDDDPAPDAGNETGNSLAEFELVDDDVDAGVYEDRLFEFETYVRCFTQSQHVVKNYMELLQDYSTNSTETNYQIVKMFHRIAIDLQMESMFFQVSFLNLFNRIMNDRLTAADKSFAELRKFIQYITHQFVKRVKLEPLLFVDALMWKRRALLSDIHNIGTPAWKAQRESMESQARAGVDVADWRVEGQLLSSNRRWSAEEDMKIREEHADCNDPNEDFVSKLTSMLQGRSFDSIRRRCRKLGLPVRCRRKAKAGQEGSGSSAGDKTPGSSSADTDADWLEATGRKKAGEMKEKAGPTAPTYTSPEFVLDTAGPDGRTERVEFYIKSLVQDQIPEYVEWLQQQLRLIADKFAAAATAGDEARSWPLLPVRENEWKAVLTPDMRQLMQALGLVPPSATEAHWTVPAALTAADLEALVEETNGPLQRYLVERDAGLLELREKRDVALPVPVQPARAPAAASGGSDDDDDADPELRALLARQKARLAAKRGDSQVAATNNTADDSPEKPAAKRKRAVRNDSSGDEAPLAAALSKSVGESTLHDSLTPSRTVGRPRAKAAGSGSGSDAPPRKRQKTAPGATRRRAASPPAVVHTGPVERRDRGPSAAFVRDEDAPAAREERLEHFVGRLVARDAWGPLVWLRAKLTFYMKTMTTKNRGSRKGTPWEIRVETDTDWAAVNDPDLMQLMDTVGVMAPDSSQYWCIPYRINGQIRRLVKQLADLEAKIYRDIHYAALAPSERAALVTEPRGVKRPRASGGQRSSQRTAAKDDADCDNFVKGSQEESSQSYDGDDDEASDDAPPRKKQKADAASKSSSSSSSSSSDDSSSSSSSAAGSGGLVIDDRGDPHSSADGARDDSAAAAHSASAGDTVRAGLRAADLEHRAVAAASDDDNDDDVGLGAALAAMDAPRASASVAEEAGTDDHTEEALGGAEVAPDMAEAATEEAGPETLATELLSQVAPSLVASDDEGVAVVRRKGRRAADSDDE